MQLWQDGAGGISDSETNRREAHRGRPDEVTVWGRPGGSHRFSKVCGHGCRDGAPTEALTRAFSMMLPFVCNLISDRGQRN
eukprot:7395965-Pyramimonas_sp.AAC.1